MSLREDIWNLVLPRVQEYRLAASDEPHVVAERCRQIAREVTADREAESLDAAGLGLADADVEWLDEQLDALLGAGPIERYLRRGDVENIWVFGPHRGVLGLSGGRQERIEGPLFANEDEMIRYVSHLATTHGQTGRRFDHSAPLLDLRLRTGERIFAAMAVCGAPYLTVRCHRHRLIRLDDLVANGSLSAQAGELVAAAVRPPAPANVLICGALGSGKTTLLRALLGEVGDHEIVCTLEQTFELFLDDTHPHTFAVETREANSDGEGEIGMEELAKRSLRSGADRVIVGELRGPEAATFLSACGTGSDGSMATIHASSPRQALSRLVRYCLASGLAGAQSALIQEAAEVIHLVVHMHSDPRTGFRGVHTITEVLGSPGDRFDTHDIFGRRQRSQPLTLLGRPRNPDVVERLAEGGLDVSGWPAGA
ncbi:MAG: CpaF family protein [Acidimicrobiales bacterium]|nr:CpaF family protein [Acidimicrobiales bacterium]MYH74256.1 CpaF family protein [Acidimicrobiales bacterium]MYI26464.1 CpaF family protein [Acidimicrobiales bacterium]MYK72198.1 CpaF family protein [Acidimicrobiales bacterium]